MNGLSNFDNTIKSECVGKIDEVSGVKYSSINISTMTVCFNFDQVLDLDNLKNNLPEKLNVNYNPGSKKSKIPKKKVQIHFTIVLISNW